jgi:hypothetical protein
LSIQGVALKRQLEGWPTYCEDIVRYDRTIGREQRRPDRAYDRGGAAVGDRDPAARVLPPLI